MRIPIRFWLLPIGSQGMTGRLVLHRHVELDMLFPLIGDIEKTLLLLQIDFG